MTGKGEGDMAAQDGRLDCFAPLAKTLTVLRHCEKIFDFRGSLVHMSGNA